MGEGGGWGGLQWHDVCSMEVGDGGEGGWVIALETVGQDLTLQVRGGGGWVGAMVVRGWGWEVTLAICKQKAGGGAFQKKMCKLTTHPSKQ